jgi:hypothetical protein
MIYSLGITIVAGIIILSFFIAVALLARKVAKGEGLGELRGWRWYPSPLAMFVLLPVLAIVLVRAAPLLFALPLIIPIIWRTRWLAGPLLFVWNLGRKARHDDDGPIDGEYRPFSDN